MIYILKFTQTIGNKSNPRGQARYYVGYCEDDRLDERLAEHRSGHGAAITRVVIEKGYDFEVALTIPGATRTDERKLKNRKNTPRFVAAETERRLAKNLPLV